MPRFLYAETNSTVESMSTIFKGVAGVKFLRRTSPQSAPRNAIFLKKGTRAEKNVQKIWRQRKIFEEVAERRRNRQQAASEKRRPQQPKQLTLVDRLRKEITDLKNENENIRNTMNLEIIRLKSKVHRLEDALFKSNEIRKG
ncbi:uncharacterized protein LOC130625476 isoform X2 [Hydractinia symbiolongicarpus]|uniref:uncharacterized protein LOC130625476 isoform X2 n=1 Tax=Hydractinia symbiolongicarpus TaxID=13093 RepID=UPI00254B1D58|nr:uncharacterized protein LOC130625476 isoform X2 [Hydractinia symbiolongicarpus]